MGQVPELHRQRRSSQRKRQRRLEQLHGVGKASRVHQNGGRKLLVVLWVLGARSALQLHWRHGYVRRLDSGLRWTQARISMGASELRRVLLDHGSSPLVARRGALRKEIQKGLDCLQAESAKLHLARNLLRPTMRLKG